MAPAAPVREPADTRWLAFGGGAGPDSNQVSIEQDLALAQQVFGSQGFLLYAGGPATAAVLVQGRPSGDDPLRAELAALFAPGQARDGHYRPTQLAVDGPANAERVLAVLRRILGSGRGRLLVYAAGHGDQGATARDNSIATWGGLPLPVADLAQVLDTAGGGRQLRLVATTCFSGGFAELAFAAADPARGPTRHDRCGLFATTWDHEASGCDPNPERRNQEGYGIHFLHALHGQDRDGRRLPLQVLDLDGDKRISLLEAHTRARLQSRSFDVPTTTSERWLRQAAAKAKPGHPGQPVNLPEDHAVIEALAAELHLPDLASARARLLRLQTATTQAEKAGADAEQAENELAWAVGADLLTRWPALNDPWHPDFAAEFSGGRDAIAQTLHGHPRWQAWQAAGDEAGARGDATDGLRVTAARVERLVRAYETVELAQRLRARGGADWQVWQRLLACERGAP